MLKTNSPIFRASGALRTLSLAGGLMAMAMVTVSCSVADDIAAVSAPAKERKTVERVTRVSKSYAYDRPAIVQASLRVEEAPAPVTISAPYNRGAWTCSPSGFGQKSQCFLRP